MKKEALFEFLRHKRLRLTKTRHALLDLLLARPTPLSVPHILDELTVRKIQVNKTTIYRELERLEQLGIVKNIILQDRKQYFELASRVHHHHFVCTECQNIMEVEIDEARLLTEAETLGRQLGFRITTHAVEFYGQCVTCFTELASCRV
ncbi:MAG: transcriptional repressor [Candidatus Moranbacteria bacterium]|jgi:Fe2+ or Zn2+ uptake regulation protein|nr:transcriptional repressor [Candidatus Moranbacteria bacterium]